MARVDRTLPVTGLTTFEGQMDRSLSAERMLSTLSTAFGAIALLLSLVGVYGVLSFVVTRRTQEISVRLALGSTRSAVLWLIVRDAFVMLGGAAAIPLPATWVLSRLVETQVYGVRAFDGPIIALASGALALAALGAALLPGWRAASGAPTEALRFE